MPKRKRSSEDGIGEENVKRTHLTPAAHTIRRSLRLQQKDEKANSNQLLSPASSIPRTSEGKRDLIAEDSFSAGTTERTKKRRTQHTTAVDSGYKDWVEYWILEDKTLPPANFFADRPMASDVPMKRSSSSTSRSTSIQGRYARLKEHGVYMYETRRMPAGARELCNKLLEGDRAPANLPGYSAEHRYDVLMRATAASEAIIQRDILPTVVPSIDNLKLSRPNFFTEVDLDAFGDEINAEWNRTNTMGGKHPKPDYVAGLRQSAFDQKAWDTLQRYATPDTPVLLNPDMCFPLVLAEAKRGATGIQIAQMQATHAAAIAVNSQIQLFWKAYGQSHSKMQELYGQPLVFSAAHNHDEVHIYAHFATFEKSKLEFHHSRLNLVSLTIEDGKYQNRPNTFFENVYKEFLPLHLKRLRDAAEELRTQEEKNKAKEELSQASTGVSLGTSQLELNDDSDQDEQLHDDPQRSRDIRFKKPHPPVGTRGPLAEQLRQSERRERELQAQIARLKESMSRKE